MKTVAHIFHSDPDSLTLGSRLTSRIAEIAGEQGISVEVFVFGPAQSHLTHIATDADRQFNAQIDALIAAGITVGTCVNAARADGTESELIRRGLQLSVARDAFVRFTLEQATVVTF